MIPVLDHHLMETLSHFYNSFKNRVIDSRIKVERKSMLLTITRVQANKLSRVLSDSALNNHSFSQTELDALAYKGYIRSLGELGKHYEYAITVKGIWCVEAYKNEMDIYRLLDYFQDTKLSFNVSSKPLKPIEKIILFAMITMRNFSRSLPMDIKSPSVGDYWVEVFDICTKQLYQVGVLNQEKWNTSQSGNEHPVSYVMRHANDLPQKTTHIYQNLGGNKYYLEVDNGNISPQKQLFSLFKLILGKIETKNQIDQIYTFCCDTAYSKSKNVNESLEYLDPTWDTTLKEALKDLYYEV